MELAKVIPDDYGVPAALEQWMRLARKVSSTFPEPETEEVMNGAIQQ